MIEWTDWDARKAQAIATAGLHLGYVRVERINRFLGELRMYLEEKMLLRDCEFRISASSKEGRLAFTFTFYSLPRALAKLVVAEFRHLTQKYETVGKCSLGPPLVCTAEYFY